MSLGIYSSETARKLLEGMDMQLQGPSFKCPIGCTVLFHGDSIDDVEFVIDQKFPDGNLNSIYKAALEADIRTKMNVAIDRFFTGVGL